jgi:hypothetical protein
MNAMQKTHPAAFTIGAGRFNGNEKASKISATNRMIATRTSNQKFSFIRFTPD